MDNLSGLVQTLLGPNLYIRASPQGWAQKVQAWSLFTGDELSIGSAHIEVGLHCRQTCKEALDTAVAER